VTAHIRPYRPEDRADCYDVCVRTAQLGGDATGLYSTDDLMGDLFFGPFVDVDPTLAFVVDTGERVSGYVIGADTKPFIDRYRAEVLPGFAAKYPLDVDRAPHEAHMVALGYNPERMLFDELDQYPAVLHIDLLPELQGHGFGRKLMDTLRAALAERGIPAVHLEMVSANVNARQFYDHLGFEELDIYGELARLAIPTS
jgi:ribosomal protein S18 acetylase RimI-like enzyme